MSTARQTEIFESWLENITGGIKNINSDHALIHDGIGMGFSIYNATMTTGQVKEYSFKAPTTKYAHVKNLTVQTLGGSVKMEILKGVTVTVDTGTAVPISNLNDNSTIVATATIKASPTYTGGTVWATSYALADSTNQTTGMGDYIENVNQELVTKSAGTYYVLKITNLTTDTIGPVVATGFFYEESEGIDS